MKILNIAKMELSHLEKDFKHVVKNTRKKKNSSFARKYGIDDDFLKSLDELERKEIDNLRKDRKYASFIVEIYAIVEQTLDDLYEKFYKEEFLKPDDKNKAIELEKALSDKLHFGTSLKSLNLIRIRNKIVHEKFSVKETKKSLALKGKSKDLVQSLIDDVNTFLNHISK